MKKTYLALTLLGLFSIANSNAQTEAELVSKEIQKSDIQSHIYFLASDELKGRETGTPEIDIAAAYIANTFRRYEVKPVGDNGTYYQNIPFRKIKPLSSIELKIGNATASDLVAMNHVNIDFEGDFIYMNDDTNIDDVSGKVVVIDNRSKNLRNLSRAGSELRAKLESNGAKAVIELVKSSPRFWLQYKNRMQRDILRFPTNDGPGITHLWLQDNDGNFAEQFSTGNLAGTLSTH